MGEREQETVGVIPHRLTLAVREHQTRIGARVGAVIRRDVPAYAHLSTSDPRAESAASAVASVLTQVLDRATGRSGDAEPVRELGRRIGRAEALAGVARESVLAAYDLAAQEVVAQLQALATAERVPAAVLERFGDVVFDCLDDLREQVESGHRAARAELDEERERDRERLARALLAGLAGPDLPAQAAAAGWALPDQMLVACVRVSGEAAVPVAEFASEVLVVTEGPHCLVLGDERGRTGLLDELAELFGSATVALSVPVAPDRLPSAARMARQLHGLAALEVIPTAPVVDCADHEVTLWLYAEPVLRQRLAQRFLGELERETPHRRRMLGLTLLAWLERHPSANVLAAELDVHPQTVRYRLRQLRDMFGDRLDDPESAFAIMLALKATLPLWTASLPVDAGV